MKEHYVSYECAVKLKELGFSGEVTGKYVDCPNDPTLFQGMLYQSWNLDEDEILAPRLDQAQAWLRDKGIHILVFPRKQCFYENQVLCHTKHFWNFDLMYIKDGWKPYGSLVEYESYEQALSAGIDKALELLTNKS